MDVENFESARNIAVELLPPSGEVSIEMIADAVARVMALKPLSDSAREALVRQLEAAYMVVVDEPGALDGSHTDHVKWLEDHRGDIDWSLWRRYVQYLRTVKTRPPRVIDRLDEVTDSILERLENPDRSGSWDRRGMVVGHVQSGKTENYIGLICKAADAGYPVIVVLAGMEDNLRSQTQMRVDECVLGFNTQQSRNFDQANVRLGVGRMPAVPLYPVNSLTSSAPDGDFSRRIATTIGLHLRGGPPLVLVIKKNKSILENLIGWLTSLEGVKSQGSDRVRVAGIPLLVIDDECDHASINTRPEDPDSDPTTINRLIRKLLDTFEQSVYVGYTATPFANIFIDVASENAERHGENLFPRDFIISLKRPSDYIGADRVFGLNADDELGIEAVEPMPIFRKVNDFSDWLAPRHKVDTTVGAAMPESLRDALHAFVLTCAARRARGQEAVHNSMLVHVTRFVAVQRQVYDQIESELAFIRQSIRYDEGGGPVAAQLQTMWLEDFEPTTAAFDDAELPSLSWEDVEPHLVPAVLKIEMRLVNGSAQEALDYFQRPEGISVIAVGGAKLSRGLTLEGLSVSYYLRTSNAYDTLLQMGRWFGFRPGYMDLCRLYTTNELRLWYRETTFAAEELLQQFDEMALMGASPQEFGLRVRRSPQGMVVTAAGKMRSATRQRVTFSESIVETVVFDVGESAVAANLDAADRLVQSVSGDCTRQPVTGGGRDPRLAVWSGVPTGSVREFLLSYKAHEGAVKARPLLLEQYISAQEAREPAELVEWTVVLLSVFDGPAATIGGHEIGLVTRKSQEDAGSFAIKRLLSPSDEFLDFSDDEMSQVRSMTASMFEQGLIKTKSGKPPALPNGAAVRRVRPARRGLLLLYPLDPGPAGIGGSAPVIGFGISFPRSQHVDAGAIEYDVNRVYVVDGQGEE
jgi:hypothetical protein